MKIKKIIFSLFVALSVFFIGNSLISVEAASDDTNNFKQDFTYENGGTVAAKTYNVYSMTSGTSLVSMKEDATETTPYVDYLRYTLSSSTATETINIRNTENANNGLWNKTNTNALISMRFRVNDITTTKNIKAYLANGAVLESDPNTKKSPSINLLNIESTRLSYNPGNGTKYVNNYTLSVDVWHELNVVFESAYNRKDGQDYLHAYLDGQKIYSVQFETSDVITWTGLIYDINIDTRAVTSKTETFDLDYLYISDYRKVSEFDQDFIYYNGGDVAAKTYNVYQMTSGTSLVSVKEDATEITPYVDYLRYTLSSSTATETINFRNTVSVNDGLWNKTKTNALISMRFRINDLTTKKSIKAYLANGAVLESDNSTLKSPSITLLDIESTQVSYNLVSVRKSIAKVLSINEWHDFNVIFESAANRTDGQDYIHAYLDGELLYSAIFDMSDPITWNGKIYDINIDTRAVTSKTETFDLDYLKIDTLEVVEGATISNFEVNEESSFTIDDKVENVGKFVNFTVYDVVLSENSILSYDHATKTFNASATNKDVKETVTINYFGGYSTSFEVSIKHVHDIENVEAQDASCTEVGWDAYEYCTKCDYTTKVEKPSVGHSYSTEWSKDETYHWYEATCEHTTEVKDKAEHNFTWTQQSAATCTNAEVLLGTCYCGYTTTKDGDEALEHDLKIKNDETHHWYECDRDNCDEKTEKENHKGGNATETEQAVCSVCNKPYGEIINHEHTYSTEWSKDETHHWYQATCEHDTEVKGKAEHTFTWTQQSAADCTNAEVLLGTCACGYTTTKDGEAALEHDLKIKNDETHHWYECDRDNCDEKTEKENHKGGTAAETEQAVCSVCNKSYGEILNHEHTYSTEWTSDATHHWHQATCAHTSEVKDKAEHSFTWTQKTPASCTTPEVLLGTCACGFTNTKIGVAATGHTYSTEWTSDATHHWHQATCAHTSEVKDKAEHNFTWTQQSPVTSTTAEVLLGTCACGYTTTKDGVDPQTAISSAKTDAIKIIEETIGNLQIDSKEYIEKINSSKTLEEVAAAKENALKDIANKKIELENGNNTPTTPDDSNDKSGCLGSVIPSIFGVIILLGTCVVFKKRKED